MVTMTICDTAPATGAAVSIRAIPVRATVNLINRGARARSGGNTVTDTASAPLTLRAGAAAGRARSIMTMARSATEGFASECDRVMHRDRDGDANRVLEPCTFMAARICGVSDISH
jgi:hypothetical protein